MPQIFFHPQIFTNCHNNSYYFFFLLSSPTILTTLQFFFPPIFGNSIATIPFFFSSIFGNFIATNQFFLSPLFSNFGNSIARIPFLFFFSSIFGNFIATIHMVRTYVIHMLGTYVTNLCNWLIFWQNALYLYLGRSRMCLMFQGTRVQVEYWSHANMSKKQVKKCWFFKTR